jgi:hypothetical protein
MKSKNLIKWRMPIFKVLNKKEIQRKRYEII